MYKASLTSKGQITIPKEIRELLCLETGDNVIFKVDDNIKIITFEKDIEVTKCPVCFGSDEFLSYSFGHRKHENYKCPVCQGSGHIKKDISALQEIANLMHMSIKYRIMVSLIQTDETANNKLIPEIKLKSNLYPIDVLNRFQDYYQVRLIDEYAPRSIADPQKFMNPTDLELNEILSLLQTHEEIEKVRKWFRYDRIIFSPNNNFYGNK